MRGDRWGICVYDGNNNADCCWDVCNAGVCVDVGKCQMQPRLDQSNIVSVGKIVFAVSVNGLTTCAKSIETKLLRISWEKVLSVPTPLFSQFNMASGEQLKRPTWKVCPLNNMDAAKRMLNSLLKRRDLPLSEVA